MGSKKGRPKKQKSELRSKPLRILLNPAERQAIDDFSKEENMESSTWARKILLDKAGYSGT